MPYSARSRTSTGGITGSKPAAPQLLQRPAHERQLEHHQVAFQIREARPRERGRAIHVDHPPRQLEVVARLEVELPHRADLAHELVLRPRSGARVGKVRQRRQGRLQAKLDLPQLLLELLRPHRHAAHALDLALARGRVRGGLDPRVRLVLLSPQPLQLGQQPAAVRVELDNLVEPRRRLRPAPRERRAHAVRVLADQLKVEHDDGSLIVRASAPRSTTAGGSAKQVVDFGPTDTRSVQVGAKSTTCAIWWTT